MYMLNSTHMLYVHTSEGHQKKTGDKNDVRVYKISFIFQQSARVPVCGSMDRSGLGALDGTIESPLIVLGPMLLDSPGPEATLNSDN